MERGWEDGVRGGVLIIYSVLMGYMINCVERVYVRVDHKVYHKGVPDIDNKGKPLYGT